MSERGDHEDWNNSPPEAEPPQAPKPTYSFRETPRTLRQKAVSRIAWAVGISLFGLFWWYMFVR